ncbi:hypothetical protein [Pedobacter gandavensis]|uniref:hypothetical protein n=1 Tax=Pedobacter gandavensis TaxID=2679963 RepID=UPI0029303D1E|nr:hypothetical protein [Pedobacter gandavensis]
MKKLLFSVMACYALTAQSQVQNSKNYLYLYSDSIIYADKIQLRPDFSGYWQLRVDSRRVPADQVKFFNNENGFFANTRKLTFMRDAEFSERIIEGKINVFQERSYDPYAYDWHHRHENHSANPMAMSMYYNKGFGDLKKLKYRNLKNDLAGHPESMKFLNTYKKRSVISKIMYATAGAAIISGCAIFLKPEVLEKRPGFGSQFKDTNVTPAYVLMGLGVGLVAGGYAVDVSKSRYMEQAIEAYNR